MFDFGAHCSHFFLFTLLCTEYRAKGRLKMLSLIVSD